MVLQTPFQFQTGSPEELGQFVEEVNRILRRIPSRALGLKTRDIGDITGSNYNWPADVHFVIGRASAVVASVTLPPARDAEPTPYFLRHSGPSTDKRIDLLPQANGDTLDQYLTSPSSISIHPAQTGGNTIWAIILLARPGGWWPVGFWPLNVSGGA